MKTPMMTAMVIMLLMKNGAIFVDAEQDGVFPLPQHAVYGNGCVEVDMEQFSIVFAQGAVPSSVKDVAADAAERYEAIIKSGLDRGEAVASGCHANLAKVKSLDVQPQAGLMQNVSRESI